MCVCLWPPSSESHLPIALPSPYSAAYSGPGLHRSCPLYPPSGIRPFLQYLLAPIARSHQICIPLPLSLRFLFLPCGSSQSTYPASPWPPRVPGSQIPGNSRQAPVELRDHQQLLTAPHWSWSFCRRATRRICRRLHLLHLQSRYVFSLC